MTGIHVVPDIQHYIGLRETRCIGYLVDSSMIGTHQLHLANADMIAGANISYQTALLTSIRRIPNNPASALTIHFRKIQALFIKSNNHDTGNYDTL